MQQYIDNVENANTFRCAYLNSRFETCIKEKGDMWEGLQYSTVCCFAVDNPYHISLILHFISLKT